MPQFLFSSSRPSCDHNAVHISSAQYASQCKRLMKRDYVSRLPEVQLFPVLCNIMNISATGLSNRLSGLSVPEYGRVEYV